MDERLIITHLEVIMNNLDKPVGFWYLSHMRAAKAHASLRMRAVSPDPSLLVHFVRM